MPEQAVMRTRRVRNLATRLVLFRVGAVVFLSVSVKGIETYLLPVFLQLGGWSLHLLNLTISNRKRYHVISVQLVCSFRLLNKYMPRSCWSSPRSHDYSTANIHFCQSKSLRKIREIGSSVKLAGHTLCDIFYFCLFIFCYTIVIFYFKINFPVILLIFFFRLYSMKVHL